MILWTLRMVTPANTERQATEPLQGRNGPLGTVGDPHRLTALNTLAPLGSEYVFRCRCGATAFSCHHVLTFLLRLWSTLAHLLIGQCDVHRPRLTAQ